MKKFGRGIATMIYPIGGTGFPNPSAATVSVHEDGSATLWIGLTDIGQGSTTIMGQIACEALGITYDKIKVVYGDTMLTPFDVGPVGSRATFITGNAVKRAADSAKEIILEAATLELKIETPSWLEIKENVIYVKNFPEQNIPLSKAVRRSHSQRGRPVIASATWNPMTTPLDPETGHGKPFGTYVFATQLAEVEVDTETGKTDILKIVAVHDCGKIINPLFVEGQVEGGVVMGLGYGVMEEIVMKDGETVNPDFTNYMIPTALDIPGELITRIVEREEIAGPFGAKGIGEPSLLPTAPAIVNAIRDAVGVCISDLPVTPEKILLALREKEKNSTA